MKQVFENEYTTMEYSYGDLECVFVNSDDFKGLPVEEQEIWNKFDFKTLVIKAHDNAQIRKIYTLFCQVSADYIGISEGEDFCNNVGYEDLCREIFFTFYNV